MPEISITSSQIVWLCSLITGLWGLWKIVKEIRKPNEDLKTRINKHDELLDKDNKRLAEVEKSNQMILKCLLVIINHDITGNGIDKMKETRDDIQQFLIDR